MNQTEENFLRYLDLVQVTLSHLLQDGEYLSKVAEEQIKSLLSTTEDLQNIYSRSQ